MGWKSSLLISFCLAMVLPYGSAFGSDSHQTQDSGGVINAVAFEQGAVLLSYSSEFGTRDRPEWVALGLIDGKTKLGWSSKKLAPLPHEFTFELSRLYQLTAFEFDNRDSDEAKYPGISAAQVQVLVSIDSPDGPYIEAASGRLKPGGLTKISLVDAVPGRWIKMVILNNGGHPEYTELMEFRAFGSPSSDDALISRATSGAYDTNWDMFYLQIKDGKLSGCYDHDEGKFDGSLTGEFLSIEWRETGLQIGKAVLAVTENGSYFNGFWYENGQLKGTWHGPKITDNREPKCATDLKASNHSQISSALEESGRAVLYGLYFDYDSDVLKAESLATLKVYPVSA